MDNAQPQNPVQEPQQPNIPITPTEPLKPRSPSKTPIIIMIIFTVISLALSGYLAYQNYNLNQQIGQSEEALPSPTADPTVDWKTYTNAEYGFSLKYPDGYIAEERAPGFVFITKPNDEDPPQAGISIEARLQKPYDSYTNADSYIKETLDLSDNVKSGIWNIYQGVGKDGMIKGIEFRQAITTYKTGVINIGTIATTPYLEIFDQILSTFKLIETTEDETANWKSYSTEDNKVSFKYPANWTLTRDTTSSEGWGKPITTAIIEGDSIELWVNVANSFMNECMEEIDSNDISISDTEFKKRIFKGVYLEGSEACSSTENSKNMEIWLSPKSIQDEPYNYQYGLQLRYRSSNRSLAENTFTQILSTLSFTK